MKVVRMLLASIGLSLFIPVVLAKTIQVPPPNGVDDTASIQQALDACVATKGDCTVQLSAGHYLTKQIVSYNFLGTLKGAGKHLTSIEALPYLSVTIPDPVTDGECLPDTTKCLWPSLFIFVNGDIHVSDFSLHITTAPGTGTLPWYVFGLEVNDLLDGLRFMSQASMSVYVDRIAIDAQVDDTSFFGFTLGNGVIFTGELPRSSTPFDYYLMTGTLVVRNSSFNTLYDGVSQDGFMHGASITVGGSNSTGNIFENCYTGMDLEGSESSQFEISHNISSGISSGMWIIPWQSAFVPTSPSRYMIHDNRFSTATSNAQGVLIYDNLANPWIRAMVWDNSILLNADLSDGIDAYNTKEAAIWNNTITGTGFDAVGLVGTSYSMVVDNEVSGFAPDASGGLGQVYLDPSTSHDLIVCAESSDVVVDQGTGNVVVCPKKIGR